MTAQNIETRCARDGTACVEVLARLDAGHRVKYVEGCREHGDALIARAARIADVHRQERALGETA